MTVTRLAALRGNDSRAIFPQRHFSMPIRCVYAAVLASLLVSCLGCGGDRAVEKSEITNDGVVSGDGVSGDGIISTEQKLHREAIPTNLLFQNVASQAKIVFRYKNGTESKLCTLLESLGGGVAAFDFDGDGRQDLCFAGGGKISPDKQISGLPLGMFRNLGDWRFEEVAAPARLSNAGLYTHGIAAADYDNDGFCDFLVTGYGKIQLWRNQGDGTFRDTAIASQMDDPRWSSSAAWSDFNADGVLDVYIDHHSDWSFENHPFCAGPEPGVCDICPPKAYSPLSDVLYFSNGDGSFQTRPDSGLVDGGKGLGVLAADVDDDGDQDIYVANDTTDNFLYLNDGQGRFSEVGLLSGTATGARGTPDGSMGVDLCDFNQDGRFDICVANYEREAFALYRNEGHGQFLSVSQSAGLTALGGLFVSFGTACADFDHDADEDIVVTNGHVILFPSYAPVRQLPLLLQNDGGRFTRIQPTSGYFAEDYQGRGLAVADLDNDGDLDVAISHLNDPVAVLRNERTTGQWLGVRLIGRASNRDAIGAKLSLQTSAGRQRRQVKGGGSYLSTNDKRVFFGFPDNVSLESLTVDWPSGRRQIAALPHANSYLVLQEPQD